MSKIQRRSLISRDLSACLSGAGAAVTACSLFMFAIYAFDFFGIRTLVTRSGEEISWAALVVPVVTMGLVGFVTGPAVAGRDCSS